MIYLIGTLVFLTTTRRSLKHSGDEDFEMQTTDIVFSALLGLGTLYFTVLEVIQAMTLKGQYVRLSNANDIAYLIINYIFIADSFLGYLASNTSAVLATIQVVLMFVVFINWLRVFENTVLYIRLIKQTIIDMMPFFFLYLVVTVMFSFAVRILNLSRAEQNSLYDDEVFGSSYLNSFLS